jgi:cell division protein FtsB
MYRSIEWLQAMRQAPWRKQFQLLGLFAGGVVFIAIIAGVYLNVTSRAATLGRQIQTMQVTARNLERDIEDLETRLAYVTSREIMAERAEKLGFQPVVAENIIYLQVAGYGGRPNVKLAPATDPESIPVQLPKAYTQSLIEWMQDIIFQVGLQTGAAVGARP